jgi:hypothetical protein
MLQTKWTERKFTFDLPAGWLPNIIERLNGTTARMKEMTFSLTERETGYKHDGKWSIKEHIGHLSDLEELHEARIDDFIARLTILRAADMSNEKTNKADHNLKSIQKLLNDFSIKRQRLVKRLGELDEETQNFKSKHPRLNKLMRPVDMAYFTAEHDDHHLATMRYIIQTTKK